MGKKQESLLREQTSAERANLQVIGHPAFVPATCASVPGTYGVRQNPDRMLAFVLNLLSLIAAPAVMDVGEPEIAALCV